MALINFSKFQVSNRLFRNPQIINLVIAIFSLFVILTGLQFFGLYEGMQQDVTVDSTNTANSKNKANGQMGPMPPMGQMGQMPQMSQMPPMYQIPSGVPQGISQPNIPVTEIFYILVRSCNL